MTQEQIIWAAIGYLGGLLTVYLKQKFKNQAQLEDEPMIVKGKEKAAFPIRQDLEDHKLTNEIRKAQFQKRQEVCQDAFKILGNILIEHQEGQVKVESVAELQEWYKNNAIVLTKDMDETISKAYTAARIYQNKENTNRDNPNSLTSEQDIMYSKMLMEAPEKLKALANQH